MPYWASSEETPMMGRMLRICVGAALLVAAAVSSAAAQEKTTIKVALFDMSSYMPEGMMSYGMMGPGMMGPWGMGPGMMGPGLMNQGQNASDQNAAGTGNQDTVGPGMVRGTGMMMAVRLDKSSVKAGTVSFDVTNWSRSIVHDLLVVAVSNPTAPLPFDYGQSRVPEEQVKVAGKSEDLEPNGSKTFDVALTPGSYLVICNVPGHYASGMVTPLTVTP
jgi:uncharacterized cupredoxin-like copper-binding protein